MIEVTPSSDPVSATPRARALGSPRALAILFLFASALISLLILSQRDLYDDELLSLPFITTSPHAILGTAAEGDVHPAGMYLLGHVGWLVTHSFRWMNLLPWAVFYVGLSVFVLRVLPLLRRTGAAAIFLLLATMHPQLLMWSNTYRWYGWWTGLALITLLFALDPTDALEPQIDRPGITTPRAILVGVLLAALFYLNYITLLFAAALVPALWLRFRDRPARSLLRPAAIIAATFALLVAPQLPIMVRVHLHNGGGQRYSLPVSFLRLVQALTQSEAFLPWHPVAIIAGVILIALAVVAIVRAVPTLRESVAGGSSTPLGPLAAFALTFTLLVVSLGLGGKPRNALVLVPILAPFAALAAATLSPRLRAACIAVISLWSAIGVAHLLGRFGIEKSDMNDHPEQVVAFLRSNQAISDGDPGSQPFCSVVVTYDPGLAFAVSQARLPNTVILSPFRGDVFAGTLRVIPPSCHHPHLFVVKSYLSGVPAYVDAYTSGLEKAATYIDGSPWTLRFSVDPDAARKRRLAALFGSHEPMPLPDFRFVVRTGLMLRTDFPDMQKHMPYYVSLQ